MLFKGFVSSHYANFWLERSGHLLSVRKMKRMIRNVRDYFAYRIFSYLNGNESFQFIIDRRPDFHLDFKSIQNFGELYESWIRGNSKINSVDISRFYFIYLNILHVMKDGIDGDVAEIGVYRGNSASILASVARKYGRTTYLFDTFEGFDSRDLKGVDSKVRQDFTSTSLERVESVVGTRDVVFVKGFFPESAKEIAMPKRFAVLHIDCDLYEPIKASLAAFYPLMSPGGVIIIHDYSSGHWLGATKAVDEFFHNKPEKPVLMPDKSGSAVVRIRSA